MFSKIETFVHVIIDLQFYATSEAKRHLKTILSII